MPEADVVFADALARSQIRSELASTLFVEAGAGTGKTSALVGRIVELIATGRAELAEIAAITFTEAAAGELRARLYRTFQGAEEPALRVHAGEIEDATITTIHGFAQRLLAEHPIEAGLPLRFEVLDEIAGSVEFERRFGPFLDALYEDAAIRPVLLGAVALGIGASSLRNLAREIDEHYDVARSPTRELLSDRPLFEAFVEATVERVAELAGQAVAYKSECTDPEDLLLERLNELDEALHRGARSADWLDRLRWLCELRPQRVGRYGRSPSWNEVTAVREAVADFERARDEALGSIGASIASALGDRLSDAAHAAAEGRRAEGRLRFHDLLVLARNLLRDHPRVRRALRFRFRFLFVDEFQDTDPLQLEIVTLLGLDEDQSDLGRLFFVGDPKQSIYSFRGADLALYERTRALLSGDAPTRLVTNFRSVPPILDFVNELFASLFFEADRPATSERAGDLVAARASLAPQAVVLVGGPAEQSTASSRRESDASAVASLLASAIASGWTIEDNGARRALRASDVAILIPTRTGLAEIEAALEAESLDYRVAHSTLIYASPEVRELLAILRAIDAPGDERAVLGALRASATGLSDVDLASWRRAGGAWRLDATLPPSANDSVHRVLVRLRELSRRRVFQSVDETLEMLIDQFSIRQLLAGRRNRAEALRRVEFVLERARAFVSAADGSISEFLDFAAREAEVGTRGVELLASDDEVEAVRILTIHGAKGLEFPFVVLADLGSSSPSGPRGASVLRSKEGSVEFRLASGSATEGFAEAVREESERSIAESLRLAYVGATRARDYLVLALTHRPTSGSPPSLAARIWEVTTTMPHLWSRPDSIEVDRQPTRPAEDEPVGSSNLEPGAVPVDLDHWRRERDALLLATRRPPRIAPSSLETSSWSGSRSGEKRRVRLSSETEAEPDESGWRRARQASAIGRAVHLTLQRVDLRNPADLDEVALGAARAERVEAASSRVVELARAGLVSPIIRQAVDSGRYFRELPFSVAVTGGTIEGLVDLCFVDEGELVIVDYKTDMVATPDELEAVALRYRLQAGSYALGLRGATGLDIRRVVLVFLAYPDGAYERGVDDLPAAMHDAELAAELALASPVLLDAPMVGG